MKVNLLFGFLGAGKTTLVRRLLEQPVDSLKTAVIVNEFGEVGVDARILSGTSVEVIELASGCLCCTLRGALPMAIEELRDMQGVERVVVEATGVAQPAELLEGLVEGGNSIDFEIGRLVTVVDSAKLPKLLPMLGEFYASQIEGADIVVLNKCDLVTQAELERASLRIRDLNGAADVVLAERGEVDGAYLFHGATHRAASARAHAHAHDASGPPVESFVLRPASTLNRHDLEDFFGSLPDTVWRAKGYIAIDGECHLLQYALGQLAIERALEARLDARYLVFIGRGMDRAAIEAQFGLAGVRA